MTETRYGGRGVTLYGNGEAVAVSYNSSTGSRSAYLGKDVLGSVRTATTDTGAVEDRYEYDAFGTPYSGDLSGGMNLGYTGKPYDTSTGLYGYGYRDYSPRAARFTTVDPVRDGNNWYAYVNNDPVNYIDLWGLSPSDKVAGNFNFMLTYRKEANTLDIYISPPADVFHGNMTKIASYSASGHVMDRSQTGPVMGTSPTGKDYGTPKQYYIPQELPNGIYVLGNPIWISENDSRYKDLGPVFIPILTTQKVPVYGETQPVRNPDTGLFEPTGTQIDSGYGVHANMKNSYTTWGCVGTIEEQKLRNATNTGIWVKTAIDRGSWARLAILE